MQNEIVHYIFDKKKLHALAHLSPSFNLTNDSCALGVWGENIISLILFKESIPNGTNRGADRILQILGSDVLVEIKVRTRRPSAKDDGVPNRQIDPFYEADITAVKRGDVKKVIATIFLYPAGHKLAGQIESIVAADAKVLFGLNCLWQNTQNQNKFSITCGKEFFDNVVTLYSREIVNHVQSLNGTSMAGLLEFT